MKKTLFDFCSSGSSSIIKEKHKILIKDFIETPIFTNWTKIRHLPINASNMTIANAVLVCCGVSYIRDCPCTFDVYRAVKYAILNQKTSRQSYKKSLETN